MIDASSFVAAVRSVVGDASQVPLHAPEIGPIDRRFVDECLASTFVSSVGPFVTRFEEEIAAYTGSAHAVAVSNGTSALQVALILAGVHPGDEVIVPALSFIATANAVVHAQGVPHFVDSDPATLGMRTDAVEAVLAAATQSDAGPRNAVTGRRIAAIVPMHTFGHPVDIVALVELGNRYGVPVVEDAAESLGSYVGDRHTGTFGRLGILSFNGNKIVTTGGGGMILTDDAELGRRAKHLTTTAKVPHEWSFDHDEVGWNYRLPNLNAALGVAQLTKLAGYREAKRRLAARYADAFADLEGVKFLEEPAGTASNYWLCSVLVEGGRSQRDALLRAANDDGLQSRPVWSLLTSQTPYLDAPRGDLTVAHALEDGVISLPSSPVLGGWTDEAR